MAILSEGAWRRRVGGARAVWRSLRGLSSIVPTLLLVIWVGPSFVPAETGLRFGQGFQVFFTVILISSAIFFWFLGQEHIPAPSSGLGVLASVAAVYLATVGLLVAVAAVSPQFGLPRAGEQRISSGAAERGEVLFSKPEVGCFLCHSIGGRGGNRGPDLTLVAARAGDRVSGLSAERYLFEKLKAGSTYQFKVSEYLPIMPAFGQSLTEEQLSDLVAYLLTRR